MHGLAELKGGNDNPLIVLMHGGLLQLKKRNENKFKHFIISVRIQLVLRAKFLSNFKQFGQCKVWVDLCITETCLPSVKILSVIKCNKNWQNTITVDDKSELIWKFIIVPTECSFGNKINHFCVLPESIIISFCQYEN